MPESEQVPDDWWKIACRVIPYPIACVALDGRFVWVNDAYCRLLGYAPSELREIRWQDVTLKKDVGGDEQDVQEIVAGKRVEYYLEKAYVKKDGKTIHVELYVRKFPDDGPALLFVACIRDRTLEVQVLGLQVQLNEEMRDLRKIVESGNRGAISSNADTAKTEASWMIPAWGLNR